MGAKPGLRVQLIGPPGNPSALGAVLRLGDGARRWGAARQLHAGAGYWSQDSAVAVLGAGFDAKVLQIKWPGGKVTTNAIPAAPSAIYSPSGLGFAVSKS